MSWPCHPCCQFNKHRTDPITAWDLLQVVGVRPDPGQRLGETVLLRIPEERVFGEIVRRHILLQQGTLSFTSPAGRHAPWWLLRVGVAGLPVLYRLGSQAVPASTRALATPQQIPFPLRFALLDLFTRHLNERTRALETGLTDFLAGSRLHEDALPEIPRLQRLGPAVLEACRCWANEGATGYDDDGFLTAHIQICGWSAAWDAFRETASRYGEVIRLQQSETLQTPG